MAIKRKYRYSGSWFKNLNESHYYIYNLVVENGVVWSSWLTEEQFFSVVDIVKTFTPTDGFVAIEVNELLMGEEEIKKAISWFKANPLNRENVTDLLESIST